MRWNAWKVATLISLILILANKKSHPHRCVAGQFFKKNLKIHGKTTIMEFNFTEKSDFFTDIFLWSLDDVFSAKLFGPLAMAGSDKAGFFEKIFLPRKWGKWAKIRVFEFIGNFTHWFFLILVYNKCCYCLQYSCTNAIFGKNQVPEIRAKFSQPIRFLNLRILRIFNSTLSLEQSDEKAWFSACC